MINVTGQSRLFEAIGKSLKKRVEVFLIGGSAMLYYNAKQATKDIDIVTSSNDGFNELRKTLLAMGFSIKKPFINTKYDGVEIDKPVMLELGEQRIDLFRNRIICFRLSEAMKSRVAQAHEYANLVVKVASPEDIILLKCATERAGDRIDAKELISSYNINWDTIIKEAQFQSKSGELFTVYLYDFLQELKEDLDVDIRKEVLRSIRKICEADMIHALKKGKMTTVTKIKGSQ